MTLWVSEGAATKIPGYLDFDETGNVAPVEVVIGMDET